MTAAGERALVAMSGGVDSAAAAYCMRQAGLECLGVTMKLRRDTRFDAGGKICCTQSDAEDARDAAFRLGMRHWVWDLTEVFQRDVLEVSAAALRRGETPNPCVACNRWLKFGALWDRAQALGCGCLATGHYARIVEKNGRFWLKTALDAAKDQTYFLYFLTQEQLAHIRFPLGELTKAQVRRLAAAQGFMSAEKPDSQDLCFDPAILPGPECPGDILDLQGRRVGRHRGAPRYTLGQRRGLGVAAGKPVYVCGKDAAANTLTVGPETALYRRRIWAEDFHWIHGAPSGAVAVEARVRYRQPPQPAVAEPDGVRVRIDFASPQRAPAPGQAVVLYQGDVVLGGGTIGKVE